jgi:hypothetical protein
MLNALRTYSRDHPALERFETKLAARLSAYFLREEELSVALEARSLLVDGQPVLTADRVENNIWFPLFAAGIRELIFEHGIDTAELLALFELLNAMRDTPELDQEGEDDAVTLLWQAELESVRFVAVDSFSRGDADDARVAALREMVESSMVKELTALSLADRSRSEAEATLEMRDVALARADVDVLRAENLSALDEMPSEPPGRAAIELDARELERFADACADEPTVVERYVDALLGALEAAPDSDEPILEQLRELFAVIVEDRRYARARRMVEQIVEAAAEPGVPTGDSDWRDRIERVVITAPTLAEVVRAIAGGGRDARDELLPLVSRLSTWAAAVVIAELPGIDDAERRAELGELAVTWGDQSQLALRDVVARTADEPRALELLRLAVRIGGGALGGTLRSALEHPGSTVRANAFRALARAAAPEADAAAIRSIGDADPTVRRLALEHVIRHRPAAATRAITRRLAGDLDGIDLVEMRRLYVAHVAVSGVDAAPWLLERLGQRGLLRGARANEERIAAAAALGYLRCADARPLLSKLAGSRLTRKDVREACAEALADLDKPAPSRAADAARESAPESAPEPEPDVRPRRAARISFRAPEVRASEAGAGTGTEAETGAGNGIGNEAAEANVGAGKPSDSVEAMLSSYLDPDDPDQPARSSDSLELLLSDYIADED